MKYKVTIGIYATYECEVEAHSQEAAIEEAKVQETSATWSDYSYGGIIDASAEQIE